MHFNTHFNLEGRHAFLRASNPHWLNYNEEKLDAAYFAALAAQKGTELHEFAHNAIRLGVKLQESTKTLNMYVNDAIGFRMSPEQPLFYSENAFGTADAVSFRKNILRIHDLKTGVTPTTFKQLLIYAGFFCLEYDIRPFDIEINLRIYQNDAMQEVAPEAEEIFWVMDRIVTFDKRIKEIRKEVL